MPDPTSDPRPARRSVGDLPTALQWAALLAVSLLVIVPLEMLHMPAALFLGPMVAAIVLGALSAKVRVPQRLFIVAQAVIGLPDGALDPGLDPCRAGAGLADLRAGHHLGGGGGGGPRDPVDADAGAAGDDRDLGLGARRRDGDAADGGRLWRRYTAGGVHDLSAGGAGRGGGVGGGAAVRRQ